jgi:hypothetical protein
LEKELKNEQQEKSLAKLMEASTVVHAAREASRNFMTKVRQMSM